MHLRNVQIFCDVVACRSFSKAAEAHHVSQSSASQAVHTLEKRLGSQLIDRSQRPFQLTPAGQVYFEGCRDLLESFRRIEDRVREMNNQVVGRVRVASIYSVGLAQMETYVREYERRYPEAEIQLEYLHPDDVYAKVVNDEADLGLVSFPRDGGEISSQPWQEQVMVVVVPPDHLRADQESVSAQDLNGEDYIGFTSELVVKRKIDRWMRNAKVSVNVVREFDNIENIKRAVEIGSGIAVLPEPSVRRECEAGSMHLLRIEDAAWTRPLGIVHKRHKSLATTADKFVELLQEDPETFPKNGKETVTVGPDRTEARHRPARKDRSRTVSKAPR